MRHLRDDRGERLPLARHRQHVAAGERRPPRHDAVGVDVLERPREAEGRAPVVVLHGDVEDLTGLALAVAEAAVVEDDHDVPGGGEALGVRVEPQRPDRAEPVSHHHHGRRPVPARRPVDAGGAPGAAGDEPLVRRRDAARDRLGHGALPFVGGVVPSTHS